MLAVFVQLSIDRVSVDIFERIFNLCDLIALYCLCVLRGSYKFHLLSVSGRKRVEEVVYDQHDGSDNCRLEIADNISL